MPRKNHWLIRALLFSVVPGLGVAAVITLIFTLWEWAENPGGIFRDASGTRWQFVYNTAQSWFVPTFLWVFVTAVFVRLVLRFAKTRRQYP